MTAPMSARSQQQGTRGRAFPMPQQQQQQQQPHHQGGEAANNRNRPTEDGGGRTHQQHQQTRTTTNVNTDHRTRNTQQGGGGGAPHPAAQRRSSDGYHTIPYPNSHHHHHHHRTAITNSLRLAMTTPPLRPAHHQSPSVYPTQRDIHGAEWYTNFPYADKPVEIDLMMMHEQPSGNYNNSKGGRNSHNHHQQQSNTNTNTPPPPKVNYCRHYLLGKCNRGTMCRFPHLEQHSVVVRHSRVARGLQDTSSCAAATTACSSLDNDQGRHSSVSPPLFALEDPGIVEATDEVDFLLPPPAMTSSSTNFQPYDMSHIDQREYFHSSRTIEMANSFFTLCDGASTRGSTPPPPPPVYRPTSTTTIHETAMSSATKRSHQPYTAAAVSVSCCNVVRHDPYSHHQVDMNDSATGALRQFFEGFDDNSNGRDTCATADDMDNDSVVEEHCCGASNTPEHCDHHNQQRCGSRHSYDHSLASATPRTEPSSAHPTPCDVVHHSLQRSDTQQFVDEHHYAESPAWMCHSAPVSAQVSPSLAYQQQPLMTARDEIDYFSLPPAASLFVGSATSLAPMTYFENPVSSQQFSSRPSTAPMPSQQRTLSNGSLTAYPMTSRTTVMTHRFAAAQQHHQPPQTTRSAAITPEEAAILKNLW